MIIIDNVFMNVDVTLATVGLRGPKRSLNKSTLAIILYTMTPKRLANTRQT